VNVLFLDPYHTGSHAAFSEGWRARSRHEIEILSLPGRHWKWRMRHAAWTLAQRAAALAGEVDAVVATDMIDLAAWRGLAPAALARLPHVLYMHENQLVYPDAHKSERDHHFGFTNILSCAAADAVWWNSGWHRDVFFDAAAALCARMPDFAPTDALARGRVASAVMPPGIDVAPGPARAAGAPLRLVWAARWEPDKGPDDFFAAVRALVARGVDIRVDVVGRSSAPLPLFDDARRELGDRIDQWGWLPSRDDYHAVLRRADVVVSTARHEFFGIAVVEAVAAGAFPLVPRRLAYPEVLASFESPGVDDGTYDGTVADLVDRLQALAARKATGELWQGDPERGRRAVAGYAWDRRAAAMDDALPADQAATVRR